MAGAYFYLLRVTPSAMQNRPGERKMSLLFFSACDSEYEQFVAPYIFSALFFNPSARVEICLQDPDAYARKHNSSLDVISNKFPGRFLIRSGNFSEKFRNSVRFLERPEMSSEYTYIGDMDILILEDILPYHLDSMKQTGLPYSNVVRPNSTRLTGLHFTRTDAYYPLPTLDGIDLKRNDEMLLYQLVERKGHKPSPAKKRPIHGFHFSIRRNPGGNPAWDLEAKYIPAYLKLRADEDWGWLLPTLGPLFWVCLLTAENVLEARHPTEFAASDDVKLIRLKEKLRWDYAP